MSSINEDIMNMIAHADFSTETNFKDVLRKRLFESSSNKKTEIFQFQRLSAVELEMVSAAGDRSFHMQQELKRNDEKNQ